MRRRPVPARAVPAPPPPSPPYGAALALGVLALVVHSAALSNGFVFDDFSYVAANPHVQQGLSWTTVRWAFTSVHNSNYHPLTWLSHALDWSLFGPEPWGHHLTGIVLHAANTALLFLLLARLTGRAGRSACVAAFFAVHPLHVESVAWVSERKDTLSTLFFLLALHAYARFARDRRRAAYPVAVAFMALGMLCKQMVVSLPAVLLLLDYWPLARFAPGAGLRLVVEKIPFLAVSAAGSALALDAQARGGSLVTLEALPASQRVANAALSYVRYLGKAAWPADLAAFYPFHAVPPWTAAAAALALVAISVAAVRARRRHPAALVGWAWYLVTLVPVIGLVQIGEQAMADRYTYIPLIGITVAVCWVLSDAVAGRPRWQSALPPLATVVVAVLSMLTARQAATWRDEVALYEHAIAATRGNYFAHANLGAVLATQGRLRDAVTHLREAARLRPDRAVSHSNLGSALFDLGMLEEAITHHRRAVDLDPGDADNRVNLGSALAAAGRIDEAAVELAEAVRLDPAGLLGRTRLARVRAAQGRTAEARHALEAVLRSDPSQVEALVELAGLHAAEGRRDEAIALLERAVAADPYNPVARTNLVMLRGAAR